APQLTWREKLVAGTYTLFDLGFILWVIGLNIVFYNFFSRSYPLHAKAINALILLAGAALVAGAVLLIVQVWP
ncbi:MAG: hypothetical protein JW934_00225, partial [Anaerolineae bacterium]|nr:hypothetical protein [Anaerolineae bacterium]